MKTAQGIDKPLSEWTVQDIKDFCKLGMNGDCINNEDCCTCQLYESNICIGFPKRWNLNENTKFTDQEIQDANTLNRILYGGLFSISKCGNDGLYVFFGEKGNLWISLNPSAFPSVKEDRQYFYHEIIGE